MFWGYHRLRKPPYEVYIWGYPRPTNSGVREGFGWGALRKNERIIISLLVGGGYPKGVHRVGGWPNPSEKLWSSNWIILPSRGEKKSIWNHRIGYHLKGTTILPMINGEDVGSTFPKQR